MSTCPLRPIGKHFAVIPQDVTTQTDGGILLPDVATDKPTRGTVVAIGQKVDNVQVGDTVLYSRFAGTEVTLDGTDYLLLTQGDILAVDA